MKILTNETAVSRNIVLTVSYDGTRFLGWQRQNEKAAGKGRTVQEEIEKALEEMHGHPVDLCGSGRTDSGVHAAGQVANFVTDIARIPADRFVNALNSLMDRDIRVLAAREAPPDFHARFDARSRTYRYFIYCGRHPLAHEMPYIWYIGRWPDVTRLNRMAAYLSGETDCTTFTAIGDKSHTRMRYIYNACFYPEGEKLSCGSTKKTANRRNSSASSTRATGGRRGQPRRGTVFSCGTCGTDSVSEQADRVCVDFDIQRLEGFVAGHELPHGFRERRNCRPAEDDLVAVIARNEGERTFRRAQEIGVRRDEFPEYGGRTRGSGFGRMETLAPEHEPDEARKGRKTASMSPRLA